MALTRRGFLEAAVAAALTRSKSPRALPAAEPLRLDATSPLAPVRRGHIRTGTTRDPRGSELTIDSCSLRLADRPFLPVMGEMHFSRYPAAEWRAELLRMKAGGIDIVASYVFWIHHEERQNDFDWSGQRSLRRFIELCADTGLLAVVRCGPWCHGEVRNGGLPDWVLKQGLRVRTDDPGYLALVRRLYGEIAGQLTQLLWKDGGPVIGIQCENEYGGAAQHLLTLKSIAREVGLDVPLYTRTGWPQLADRMPPGEMPPLFGSYADGFWNRELTAMPGRFGDAFLFRLARTDQAIATDRLRTHERDADDVGEYPYFCCEIGGGMTTSYHRRIRIAPKDIEAVALVKLGSGNNLQGYYMYHGGTNPEGRLTSLQESQRSGEPNDLPTKSYDFQAPLGEFGQKREHYDRLRRLHLFVRDFGDQLARQPAWLPEQKPVSAADTDALRWAARTDGESGFVFISNYHRFQPMAAKQQVQLRLLLHRGELLMPEAPVTVPADGVFFWPFNLDLAGLRLVQATAQPVCRLEHEGVVHVVFAKIADLPADFAFDAKGTRVDDAGVRVVRDGRLLRMRGVQPGTAVAARLRAANGQRIALVLLAEQQSFACWKGRLAGVERLFLTDAGLALDGDRLRLTATGPGSLAVSIFPPPSHLTLEGVALAAAPDGLFTRYQIPQSADRPGTSVEMEPVRAAGPARRVVLGSARVALAPSDEDFARAAVWRIHLPRTLDRDRDLLLRFRYVGDVARISLDGRLLTDNFYNGTPFEFGLRRYAPDVYGGELTLSLLPLSHDAPIYLPSDARPDFSGTQSVGRLEGVEIVERRHLEASAGDTFGT